MQISEKKFAISTRCMMRIKLEIALVNLMTPPDYTKLSKMLEDITSRRKHPDGIFNSFTN